MKTLILSAVLLTLCVVVLVTPSDVSADRRGKVVCGNIPPDEAIAFTYQAKSFGGGTWYACGPIQCTLTSTETEEKALGFVYNERKGTPRYVCRGTAVVGSKRHTVSIYRLGHDLGAGDNDVRWRLR